MTLSQSANTRYLAFSFLYIAQGIPFGTLSFAIPAWMAINGHSAGEIGAMVGITLLPWSFKLVYGPLMDRFTYLPMGRRRPWVLFAQIGIVIGFLALAFIPDPLHNMSSFIVVGFLVNCFSSLQDVATDGMAIELVPENEQARANGFMWGAKSVGTFGSLAASTWLINAVGYAYTMLFWGFIIALIFLIPLFLRERRGEKILPFTQGQASEVSSENQLRSWRVIARSLWQVIKLPSSLLFVLLMFLLGAGTGLIDRTFSILSIQNLGWTDSEYANLTAVINVIAGIGGMIIGGILVDRFGKMTMLKIYLILMIVVSTVFALTEPYWMESGYALSFMSFYYTFYVFHVIATFAVAMQLSWKSVAATQFTLYMAANNLGSSLGSGSLGLIRERWDWPIVFLIFSVLLCVVTVLISLINLKSHSKKLTELKSMKSSGEPN